MRYLGASVPVLAAMTFSLTPLGQTARAVEDKFTVESMIGRNSILPFSAISKETIFFIERYVSPPTLLQALASVNVFCGKDASGNVLKCGTVTTGTITGQLAIGFCPGKTFTFAAIYYEWTAHNNQSNASPSPIPPNSVADIFNANWTTGFADSPVQFHIFVPAVRPDHETTAFKRWSRTSPTWGGWQQTLVPPSSDPTFDFSGEHVNEFAAGQAGPDMCHFEDALALPFDKIQNKPFDFWIVQSGNIYKPDDVGYGYPYVNYYRAVSPTLKQFGFCGTRFGQEMEINAPSDPPNTYTLYGSTNTGDLNALGASMTKSTVTSIRAGMPCTRNWPGEPTKC